MLINCPECSCSISEHAHMCPHCGFPLRIVSNDFEIQGDTLIKYIGGRYDKTIVIPNGVKRICESIFDDAYLEERVQVFVPKSVTAIDDKAFSFVNLIDITVDVDNREYCSENGVLFNKRKTELIRYPENKKETQYVVPDTVTTIKYCAFGDCSNLETVQLANGLTDIEDSAFSGCVKLQSIYIPSNVRHIGECAFSGCVKLQSIYIPSNVQHIGECAFNGCINLIDIIVNNNNPAYNSLDGVLFETHSMTLHSYPANKEASEYIIPDNVQIIGNLAFCECSKLKSIFVPQTVTRIGDDAFLHCKNLRIIEGMNGVTFIGKSAFKGCEKLKSVHINDGIKIISRTMFLGCKSMQQIKMSNSIVLIEKGAFYGCERLKTIRIPPNTERIEKGAFAECTNLSTIRIPKNTDLSDDPFKYCDGDFRIIRY